MKFKFGNLRQLIREAIENAYEILGVDQNATQDEINRAYRSLAKEFHPDAGGSAEKMVQLNTAKSVLSDPAQRQNLDASLNITKRQPAQENPPRSETRSASSNNKEVLKKAAYISPDGTRWWKILIVKETTPAGRAEFATYETYGDYVDGKLTNPDPVNISYDGIRNVKRNFSEKTIEKEHDEGWIEKNLYEANQSNEDNVKFSRKLEGVEQGQDVFWNIEVIYPDDDGKAWLKVYLGKLGTRGRRQTRNHKYLEPMLERAHMLYNEKIKEGYKDVTESGGRHDAWKEEQTKPREPAPKRKAHMKPDETGAFTRKVYKHKNPELGVGSPMKGREVVPSLGKATKAKHGDYLKFSPQDDGGWKATHPEDGWEQDWIQRDRNS